MPNRNKIIDTITDYFSKKKEVVAVYLFGSFASEKEKPFSDIDLALLIDPKKIEQFYQKRLSHLAKLSRATRSDIDLVIMNTASEGLLKQIYLKGKCIIVNDEQKLSLFRMVSHSKIADFDYANKIMQSGVIKSILRES